MCLLLISGLMGLVPKAYDKSLLEGVHSAQVTFTALI